MTTDRITFPYVGVASNQNARHRIPWSSSSSSSSSQSYSNTPNPCQKTEAAPLDCKNSTTTCDGDERLIMVRSNYNTFSSAPLHSTSVSGEMQHPSARIAPIASSSSHSREWSTIATYIFAGISSPRRSDINYSFVDRKFESNFQQAATLATSTCIWKALMLSSVALAVLACVQRAAPNVYMDPQWQWDHNIYIPRSDSSYIPSPASNNPNNNGTTLLPLTTEIKRITLMAQTVTSRPLRRLTDISSRPNRAYARQWMMDYTLYDSDRSLGDTKSCFDKIMVLNTILDKQDRESTDPLPLWPFPPRVKYDALVLLPPDSIVTELDINFLDRLLPQDKLVAIAGWSSDGNGEDDFMGTRKNRLNSESDIVLFNLRHKHVDAVAKLWWELALPTEVTCGAQNDLGMLVTAIAAVMDPGEDLNDLIEPITESRDGRCFVGRDHLIKCIPPSVPESRSTMLWNSLSESQVALQETADAVCYRFYPKCEVIT